MEQPEYNLLKRKRVEQEYAPLYDAFELGLTTFSPLASGILTGKYNNGIPEGSRLSLDSYQWLRELLLEEEDGATKLDKVRALSSIAQSIGTNTATLALAWVMKNPRVSCTLLGCSKIEQLEANLEALKLLPKLDDELMANIDKITA